MAKKDLADGLRSLTNRPAREKQAKAAVAFQEEKKEITTSKHYRPSRDGTKAITAHADPAVSKQLRQLALDEDTSVQSLVHEALNLLFEKYGLVQIAPDRFRDKL